MGLIGLHCKPGRVVFAGENTPARNAVKERARVPARNEHSFQGPSRSMPFNRNPVSGILTGKPKEGWQTSRANLLQPDQADADHRMPVMELRAERLRKQPLNYAGISSEVDQQPPFYRAPYNW